MSESSIENLEKEIAIMKVNFDRIEQTLKEKKIELKLELEKNNKINIVDRLPKNNIYFSIDEFSDVSESTEDLDNIDNHRFKKSNYFHTKEEAKDFAIVRDLFMKIIRARNKARKGWTPEMDISNEGFFDITFENNLVLVSHTDSSNHNNHLTFKDFRQVELFRRMVSDEKIINFLKI